MPFRLKLRATELDLPLGELEIGRGMECFLRIDDELVSRRHARLIVSADKVVFEDLDSRNGSKVNGVRVEGTRELKVGDEVEIGSQTFRLLDAGRDRPQRWATATIPPIRECLACLAVMSAAATACPKCGAAQGMELEEDTRSVSSFELLLGVGDKMLALGRTDEAERMLAPRLRDLGARSRRGDGIPDDEVRAALLRGLRLAAATGRPEWYAFIFDLARTARFTVAEQMLDDLHAHMLLHKPVAAATSLQAYLDAQPKEAASLRRRLEALLRFCR